MCGSDSVETVCSDAIDEDMDTAGDASFVQSGADPVNEEAAFEVTDAPADLLTLTDIAVDTPGIQSGWREASYAQRWDIHG